MPHDEVSGKSSYRVSDEGGGPGFVGRRDEIAWLRGRLRLARSGYGHLVLVEGDAGVGKTRLSLAILDEAKDAGALVVRGRCYEHLDLAYLPLRDGLFRTLAEHPSEGSEGTADLDLVRAAGLDDDVAGDAERSLESERTRRMLALTRLVVERAREGLLVLFLDDIHWADSATVELLLHLLFRLDDDAVPFLAVVTARGDPDARAAAGLSRLRREPRVATLWLHPLSVLEAAELVREVRPDLNLEQARQLAAAGHGNPLLIEALARDGGTTWLDGRSSASAHPLMEAVEAVLDHLDETTRLVVRNAAFLLPDCTRASLGELCALSEEALEHAIGRAVDERVLVDDHGTLNFVHPLQPHMLRSQVGPASQREIHARVAAMLLRRIEQDDPAVSVRGVAHHLIEAGAASDRRQLFDYACRAGDEAMGVSAWEEAARCYEAALANTGAEVDDDRIVTLHQLAGLCRRAAMDLSGAVRHFQDAIALMGTEGDPMKLTELHLWRIRCAAASQDIGDVAGDRAALEQLVDIVEGARPDLAAEGLVELAQSYWVSWDLERSEHCTRRAMEIAARCGDDQSYARATTQLCVPLWIRYELEESLTTLQDGVRRARAAVSDSILAGGPLFRVPLVLTWLGRFDDAERCADECCASAERLQYPLELGLPLAALAQIAAARGDYDAVERHAHQALLIQRLFGYHWASGLFLPPLVTAHVARGRWSAARAALATWQETATAMEQETIGMLSRYVDACERGHPIEGLPLPRLPRHPAVGVDTWAAAVVEIARHEGVGDVQRAYDLLGAVAERGGVVTSGLVMLVSRLLGIAADLLGDEAAAIEHLRDAITIGERLGAEAELARARVDLATVLLRRGERREAWELLDRSTAVFEQLAMTPDTERAGRLAGGPGALAAARDAPVTTDTVTVLFSDVVDSTHQTEELGATHYRVLAREVEELVMSTIAAHGGTVVTGLNLGDGFIGLFPAPTRALSAAQQCAENVGATGLHLHLAVHSGEVIVDGDRIYGGPVNYAARICSLTGPDEILVSDLVRRELANVDDVAFVDRGEHGLKGIDGPQRLWAVVG